MYISDCIEGTKKIFNSNLKDPYNVGSSEQVSINQMIEMIEEIADYKVKKNYQLDKPKGVRGRSSNNDYVTKKTGWKSNNSLKEGLTKTYKWIEEQISSGSNIDKFSRNTIE